MISRTHDAGADGVDQVGYLIQRHAGVEDHDLARRAGCVNVSFYGFAHGSAMNEI